VLISKNPNKNITTLYDQLNEYVGYPVSADMFHTMEKMDYEQIVKFKESLEDLLVVMNAGKTYH
jgi:hypothetical protein